MANLISETGKLGGPERLWINFWLWSVGHIIIALSPLAIITLVLKVSGQQVTPASLLGDGFLFFFGVVLAADLFSDVLKFLPKLSASEVAIVLSCTLLYVLTAWIGYFVALEGRLGPNRGDGAGFAVPSIFLSGLGLILTLGCRYYFGLW